MEFITTEDSSASRSTSLSLELKKEGTRKRNILIRIMYANSFI